MKIRLKEDINMKDLMENDWEGCHSWTLDFLKQYYGERKIFEAEKVEKGSYRIYDTDIDEDYIEVNEKCFEELEEKKIPEKIEDISEIKCVGCKVEINIAGNKTLFDTDTPIVTEHCIFKINQLIKNQKKIIDYLKSKGE